jgi:DnaD/phage-associated family protein
MALCEIGSDLQSEEVCLVPGVPYTHEELADEAAIPVDEVEPALQMMAALKMIERRPDCILVVNLRKRQGWDGDNSAERTREYRKRKKAAGDGNVTNGDGDVTDCDGSGDADVTTLDKDRDKDRDNNPDDDNAPEAVEPKKPDDPLKAPALAYINGYCAHWALAGDKWEQLLEAGETQGWPLVVEAVKRTATAGAKDLKYPLKILQTWREEKLTTVEAVLAADAARAADQKRKERAAPGGRGRESERSNVKWRPKDGKPSQDYSHIYKRFENDPDPPKGDGRESA